MSTTRYVIMTANGIVISLILTKSLMMMALGGCCAVWMRLVVQCSAVWVQWGFGGCLFVEKVPRVSLGSRLRRGTGIFEDGGWRKK